MVELTKNFMRILPNEKKKIQLIPQAVICHIDESAIFQQTVESEEKLNHYMRENYAEYEYINYKLEQVFEPGFAKNIEFDKIMKSTSNEHFVDFVRKDTTKTPIEQLNSLFDGIKKTTAKEDLLWNLKMAMLISIARREGCSYIFIGDSATRQAIKMISMTAKGRGHSAALDVSVDNYQSFPDICIMRPMKDMLAKEIAFYNRFSGIDKYVISPFNYSTKMPGKSSIERLTEEFIVSIEQGFSSTVSTICRTIMKLTPAADIDYSRTCAICMMPVEPNISQWRKHITVAEVEDAEVPTGSETTPAITTAPEGDKGCDNCNGHCHAQSQPKVDMNNFLCYSCQVNLKDYTERSIESLPPYVTEKIHDEGRDDRLLDQIKDFLIEDNE
ncbi:hypothetical protein BDF20DRAFT_125404 [Mycotypha africana]|uniref:uncharacterized protein n=1 Tax=Mycotypha africana TaxID=64632 RepID=UPI00230099A9|nr:uncharacterized protein BDF20DRAFT_125404 [Mycotypha africana]KAI8970445.1 hypothetical protein BDF20DRAFT_125404 [Mycotypha africana]